MPEPTTHDPCCSAHGVPMTCARYRRTHFVEVRPCCAADAAALGTPQPATWIVTFGLGTPWGNYYTAVTVDSRLPVAEQEERVRTATFAAYGTAWAFNYPPEEYDAIVLAYRLFLREELTA